MNAGFHLNPETGRAGQCKAKIECRFKLSEEEHYSTMEEAQAASEAMLSERYGATGSTRKRAPRSSKPTPVVVRPRFSPSSLCEKVSMMDVGEVVSFGNSSPSNHARLGAVIGERCEAAKAYERTLMALETSQEGKPAALSPRTLQRLSEDLGSYRAQTALMANVYQASPFFTSSLPSPEASYQEFLVSQGAATPA